MNNPFKHLFDLPKGILLFLGIYAFSFPVLLAEHLFFHSGVIEHWLALSPALVWKGQIWRLATYSLVTGNVIAWAVSLFWFVTLISILGRNWSPLTFWLFCLFCAFIGAIPILLLLPKSNALILSAGAVIFGLLVAWAKLYGRERLVMLGIGEMSVRQAALFIAGINALIAFFSCGGILFTLSLACGSLGGWAYLTIARNRIMRQHSRIIESKRMARLEL